MVPEHSIGQVIDLPNGRKVEVVKDNKPSYLLNYGCWVCAFGKKGNKRYCATIAGECSGVTRTDHKNVIYKEIK